MILRTTRVREGDPSPAAEMAAAVGKPNAEAVVAPGGDAHAVGTLRLYRVAVSAVHGGQLITEFFEAL